MPTFGVWKVFVEFISFLSGPYGFILNTTTKSGRIYLVPFNHLVLTSFLASSPYEVQKSSYICFVRFEVLFGYCHITFVTSVYVKTD